MEHHLEVPLNKFVNNKLKTQSILCTLFVLWALFFPRSAFALSYRGTLGWVNLGVYSEPAETVLNPKNAVLKIPNAEFLSEWRPNILVNLLKNRVSLVANPRVRLLIDKSKVDSKWEDDFTQVYSFWNAAYFTASFPKGVQFAYGIQNYEWGPAELYSPSNKVFTQAGYLKGLNFESHGKELARVNITYNRNSSLVMLALLNDVKSYDSILPRFQRKTTFENFGVAKYEFSSDSGEQLIGLVGGAGMESKWHGGGYFAFKFGGFSLYYDGVVNERKDVVYPKFEDSFSRYEMRNEKSLAFLSVPGLRYEFENGNDIRMEYYHNSIGYDEKDIVDSLRVVTSPSPFAEFNLATYLNPQFSLQAKQYVYGSMRLPSVGFGEHLTLSIRHLFSLTDKTNHSVLAMDIPVTDTWELFGSGLYAGGKSSGELTRMLKWQGVLGSRYTW